MANCTNTFAFGNEEQVFIKKEVTCGTLIVPGVGDRVYCSGAADFTQDQEFIEDPQVRLSASKFSPIKGRKNVGDLSINTLIKPSGTPGTAPEAHVLLECLMGISTPNAGVSVVYTLADQLDSYSCWIKKGHTVFAFRGCVVQGADFKIAGGALGEIGWKCQFMEELFAGTCEALDTCGAGKQTIILAPTGALRFRAGTYVKVGTDDNSGAGYRITSVNFNLNTITLASVTLTDQGTNPLITPWLPTASAEVGDPVHGKLGYVTIGGQNAVVLDASVSINNNLKFYTDEKNNSWTPEQFSRPKTRDISGSLNIYYLQQGPSYFYRAEYQIPNAIVIPVGNVAGKIMELSIPYAEYGTPKVSGTDEFQEALPFKALASSGNDELSIVLK